MNKQQAKREACSIVALLIENYFDVGQPDTECEEGGGGRVHKHKRRGDEDCPDCDRLRAALEAIRDELERRGGPVQRLY
jgi:hypothetical protein